MPRIGGLVRRTATAILLTAVGLALAGCSTATDTLSAPSPAQKLADMDGDNRPASQYQRALDTWASRCNERPEKLAGYVYATVQDLQKNGINDETEYSALTHLRDSTPAGVKMKCEDVAAVI
ncbi:hypothetical protein ACGFX8_05695 [Streptomyces sp. NPDC048362]|uniref:hypothetical protein n=1 Tax=Streptomyces sp. NPDC048362 TaxID=3365539 RepID=UPI003720B93D